MLEVSNLSVSYGQHPALQDVSLNVSDGEIVVILGANGAGKSTLLRAIGGICEGRHTGTITLDGHPLHGLGADQIVDRGIALVPEGRGIFADLTVRENLILGAYSQRARDDEAGNLDRVLQLFPKLQERQGQIARTMSGGEQQMVAIARAMMSAPRILMLDEPSLGLSPLLCKELFQSLKEVRRAGIGILLVEQNAKQSLAIADRGYLLENTRIVHEDRADTLARDPAVRKAYLGGGSAEARPAPLAQPAAAEVDAPLPPAINPAARPQALPRLSAEQLIGTSIDDLVRAADSRAVPPAVAGAVPAARRPKGADGRRLQAVLADIERAAAEARNRRPATTRKGTDPAPARDREGGAGVNEAPVVIEVYRAPRVEVYRRRPGAQNFTRD